MLMKKIISLPNVIEKDIKITYSQGLHARPIYLLNELQKTFNVKISFTGVDGLGETQTFAAGSQHIMSIGLPTDKKGNINIIKVSINGENAALAMQEIEVLMASNFGLNPVSLEIDKEVSGISLVKVFNEFKALYPEAGVVLKNNNGLSLSNETTNKYLQQIGFFDTSKISLDISDKHASKIIEDFNSLMIASNKRVVDIHGKGILNRGFSLNARLAVFCEHQSIMDAMNLEEILVYNEDQYNKAIRDAEQEITLLISHVKPGSTEEQVWQSRLLMVQDSALSYKSLLKGGKANVAKELIVTGRKFIDLMKNMALNSEKNEDFDEAIMCILNHLGVAHFNNKFDEFMAKEARKGPFVLVSDKFPLKSVSAIGNAIVGFMGIDRCQLSVRSHPVLVAKESRVPVAIVNLSAEEVKGYKNVAMLVDRENNKISIIFDPLVQEQSDIMNSRKQQVQSMQSERAIIATKPNMSSDGIEFPLSVNINKLSDVDALKELGTFGPKGQGPELRIGMVRTEMLYGEKVNDHDFLVNAAEQSKIFRQLFESINESVRLRIRGLDHNPDDKLTGLKIPDGYYTTEKHNRGKVLMDANLDVYRAQIRAIFDAATATGRKDVEIFYPMVNSAEHAELIRDLVISEGGILEGEANFIKNMINAERGSSGINVKIGCMVEDKVVLSKPGLLAEILDLIDFVNIGTNDFGDSINQSRHNQEKLIAYNPLEFLMYKGIIKEALAMEKAPCICGGLAGDSGWAYLFSAVGASVSPSHTDLHTVKNELVNSSFKKLPELEEKIIGNNEISDLLNFVSGKMNVTKQELASSPMLIAQFYDKLESLSSEEKDQFISYMRKASTQMRFEIQSFQERELDSI